MGTGWLLTGQGVLRHVNWLWQGRARFCLWRGGLDRVTFTFFVLFAAASVMSCGRWRS
jgi:hypothetical protein